MKRFILALVCLALFTPAVYAVTGPEAASKLNDAYIKQPEAKDKQAVAVNFHIYQQERWHNYWTYLEETVKPVNLRAYNDCQYYMDQAKTALASADQECYGGNNWVTNGDDDLALADYYYTIEWYNTSYSYSESAISWYDKAIAKFNSCLSYSHTAADHIDSVRAILLAYGFNPPNW